MASLIITSLMFITISLLLLQNYYCEASSSSSSSATLALRRVPTNSNISDILARDRARHQVLYSASNVDGVVSFPLGGTFDTAILGFYYVKLQLGTPARDFYVIVDTGSHISWISCITCTTCPKTTTIQNISVNLYDPGNSGSASFVNCNDTRCNQVAGSKCSKEDYRCHYEISYQEGDSRTSGYFVEDLLSFTSYHPNSAATIYTTPIMFGCTTAETAGLMGPNRALDGIFGLGRKRQSLISQLASRGVTPWAFSICLNGNGGGALVFGAIVEPDIVYSPLVPSSSYYNLNLKFISVNGRKLEIPRGVFARNRGATIDSGTSLALLPKKAYNALIAAIDLAVSASPSQNYQYVDSHCYLITSSVSAIFPQVSFNFQGDVSMTLGPLDYLIPTKTDVGGQVWCMGFKESYDGVTILGEIFMKNKFFIYDLAGERIGWTNYDCSKTVNVTTAVNGSGMSDAIPLTRLGCIFWAALSIVLLVIID